MTYTPTRRDHEATRLFVFSWRFLVRGVLHVSRSHVLDKGLIVDVGLEGEGGGKRRICCRAEMNLC